MLGVIQMKLVSRDPHPYANVNANEDPKAPTIAMVIMARIQFTNEIYTCPTACFEVNFTRRGGRHFMPMSWWTREKVAVIIAGMFVAPVSMYRRVWPESDSPCEATSYKGDPVFGAQRRLRRMICGNMALTVANTPKIQVIHHSGLPSPPGMDR